MSDVDDHVREVPVHLMAPQVTADASAYADAHTTPRSPAVLAVARETAATSPTPMMIGGHVEQQLLAALVMATRARRVLEVGTFTGATALALSDALPEDGRLITIEADADLAATARRHLTGRPNVELLEGDARELVGRLEGPFDVVFIDAWKSHYVDYYEALLPKLADNGVIVADNVLWSGLPFHPDAHDGETEGVRRFVAHVQADPRTHNALLTVGDGLMLIWSAPA